MLLVTFLMVGTACFFFAAMDFFRIRRGVGDMEAIERHKRKNRREARRWCAMGLTLWGLSVAGWFYPIT